MGIGMAFGLPIRRATALFTVAAISALSANSALAAPLSSTAEAKLVERESGWASAFTGSGERVRVIVEFAMPALPDLPQSASEAQRDAAHVSAVRSAQERILGKVFDGPSGIASAQSSSQVGLKLMSFVPQFALTVSTSELEKLAADPSVVKIYADKLDRPLLDQSVPLIGMTTAYAQGATGNGFRVAVLDTGGRRGHEFLSTRIDNEACFNTTNAGQQSTSRCPGGAASSNATGSGEDCNSTPTYGCGHGTHVAGTAAGFNTNRQTGEPANGVARDARILAINVFSQFAAGACGSLPSGYNSCVLSYQSDQIAALDYVNSVRSTQNIASVNMSLGGGAYSSACDSTAPQTAIINTLRANNVAVIIAAGNDGLDTQVGAPGCISSAITVASSTKSDVRSSFSNWGSLIDVVAPGSDINASYTNNGNIGYSSLNGTSMATPHVAGAWAAIRSAVPSATVTQIENALKSTGLAISSVGTTKPRIRVAHALAALTGGTAGPANDNFANRITITPSTGTVTASGSNVDATFEGGEPVHAGRTTATTSVWWRVTPAVSGTITISTTNSDFDTVLAVYTGSSVGALTAVASNDDNPGGGLQSIVSFSATAGVQYQIAVAGYNAASGSVRVNVTGGGGATPPPTASLSARLNWYSVAARNGVLVSVLGSMTNTGSTTASNCYITKPSTASSVTLHFAARNSNGTYQPTNSRFSIAPGATQQFVILVSSSTTFNNEIAINYACNSTLAPSIRGLNTLLITTMPSTPSNPVMSATTPTNDNILNVPQGGNAAVYFNVQNAATTNALQARVSTLGVLGTGTAIPVTVNVCMVNLANACLTTASTAINFGLYTNTFARFKVTVTSNGTAIALNNAHRVYLHIYQGGVPVGSHNVQVRTTSPDADTTASLDQAALLE